MVILTIKNISNGINIYKLTFFIIVGDIAINKLWFSKQNIFKNRLNPTYIQRVNIFYITIY